MVQLSVHEVQRGKYMINEVTVHKGSSKVQLPYDMLPHIVFHQASKN